MKYDEVIVENECGDNASQSDASLSEPDGEGWGFRIE
jgi:hypothetical protein